jgi:hypothetical protein
VANLLEIVLVCLGKKKMPKYVFANLRYLRNRFPNYEIVLISDSVKTIDSLKNLKVTTFLCSDYLITTPREYLNEIPDLQFRGGFWFYTIARFFAIEDYLKTRQNKSVLHVESDVLLLGNFPFEKFNSIKGLAFPTVNLNYAAASTLYISDFAAANALSEFSRIKMYSNPAITDMEILGSSSLSELVPVTYLPTAFGGEHHFQDWVSSFGRETLKSGIEKFEGIFDAMTWGQYLTGEDPRNNYGKKRIYGIQTHHSLAVDSYCIQYLDGEVNISCECGSFPLYSLHVHSKDLRLFKQAEIDPLLKRRVKEITKGEFSEYIWPIVIKFLPLRMKNSIKKRIRKLKFLRVLRDRIRFL